MPMELPEDTDTDAEPDTESTGSTLSFASTEAATESTASNPLTRIPGPHAFALGFVTCAVVVALAFGLFFS
jgi:hypothetical protein